MKHILTVVAEMSIEVNCRIGEVNNSGVYLISPDLSLAMAGLQHTIDPVPTPRCC